MAENKTKLADAVKQHPNLFDRNNADFIKKIHEAFHSIPRGMSWKEVAQMCKDSVPNCQQNWEELLPQFKASDNSSSKRGLSKSRNDGADLSCMELMAACLLPNTNVDLGLHGGTSSSGTVTDLLNNSNSSLNVSAPSSMEIHDETSHDQRLRYTRARKRDLDQKLVKDLNESWSVAASPTTRGKPIKGGSKRGKSKVPPKVNDLNANFEAVEKPKRGRPKVPPKDNELNANFEAVEKPKRGRPKVPPKDNELNANFEAVKKPNASRKVKKLAEQPFSKPVINHTDSEAQCTILESKQDHLEFLASFVPEMETYSNSELIVFKCRLYEAALEIVEMRKKKETEKSTDKSQTTNETQSPGANPVIPESLIRRVIATIWAEFSKIPKITNAAETPITTPATTATVTTRAAATKGATTTTLNATVVTAAPQSKPLMAKVVASRPLQGQPKVQIIPVMTPPNTMQIPQGIRIIPKSCIQDGSNVYVHPAPVSTKVQKISTSVPSASTSGPSNKSINVRTFSPGQRVTPRPVSSSTATSTTGSTWMPRSRFAKAGEILTTTANDINGSGPQYTIADLNPEVFRQVRREAIGTLSAPNKATNSIKQVYRVPTASSSRTTRQASLSTATSTTGSTEVAMSIPGYSNYNLAKSAEQQSYTNVPSTMSASPRPQKRTIVQPTTSKPQPKKKRTQSTYMSTSPSEVYIKKEPE